MKLFSYCFDKWWRPIFYSCMLFIFLSLYGLYLGSQWNNSQNFGLTFLTFSCIVLTGLFFSIIYQAVKKRWIESGITALYLCVVIATIFYIVCKGSAIKTPDKVVERYSSGKMKKKIIYPFNGATLFYTELIFFENGQLKSSIDYYGEQLDGNIFEYFENGNAKFIGTLTSGGFNGIKYNYYEKGGISQKDSLFGICKIKDSCCDGIITRYYPNGNIKERFTIKYGKMNGEMLQYYESGKINRKCIFINDKKDGIQKEWNENGTLITESSYTYGIKDGSNIEYYRQYNIYGQYINGREEGEWKYIDTLGNIIKIDVYQNGVKTQSKKVKIS
jgi:antitoxin component YwqK of YwqJK toxin-antitoxin module